jgi:hypothetical protein
MPGWLRIVLSLRFWLIIGALLLATIILPLQAQWLVFTGDRAEGVVIDVIGGSRYAPRHPIVQFTTTQGQTISHQANDPVPMLAAFQVGQPVTVFYNARRAEQAIIADQVTAAWVSVVPTVGLGVIPYVIWLRRRMRQPQV